MARTNRTGACVFALAAITACSGGSSSGKAYPMPSRLPIHGMVDKGAIVGKFLAVGGPYGAPNDPQRGRILVRQAGRLVMTVQVAQDGNYLIALEPGRYTLIGYTPQFHINGRQAACRSYPSTITVRRGKIFHAQVLCQRN